MSDPFSYTYPSPLAGWGGEQALTEEKTADGKSLVNPQTGVLSKSYEQFTEPLDGGIRGALSVSHSPLQAADIDIDIQWERGAC
jgi:hypothetical protein